MAEEVERQKDGAQMYKAVALLTRRKAPRPVVEDVDGHIVGNAAESVDIIKGHFCKQFSVPGGEILEPFVGEPRPLQRPITTEELQQSITRLNNNRSSGPDGVAAELLKYAGPMLIGNLTDCLNRMFEHHSPLDLGSGIVIPLQKPNKKRGPPANLRPIVLLDSVRKAVSLLALRRIQPAVNDYLSATHSGFRPGRSTADAVWTHRWLAALTQKHRTTIEALGID
eukprot:scpid104349/ scgid7113/ 